jgi:hypothetical protein
MQLTSIATVMSVVNQTMLGAARTEMYALLPRVSLALQKFQIRTLYFAKAGSVWQAITAHAALLSDHAAASSVLPPTV